MVAIFQTPQLAAIRLNEEKEAAAIREFVGSRFRFGVLDVEMG
jgi:hypothetical protein